MNRIIITLIALVVALAACKTTKQAQSPYTTDPAVPPKVFTVPTETVEKETPPAVKTVEEKPIAIRKEQVTFTQQEDRSENESNTYFVIVGSFSQLENAKNYRETLLDEGFTPIILHSETGYYRVCVNSYRDEGQARTKVTQIRGAFPKYSDAWLLIKE